MTPEALKRWTPILDKTLNEVLPSAQEPPGKLHEAMRYSVLAGGKRLRPVLAICAYEACGRTDSDTILPAAAAIELLHTYSLIHDDLPAMDDDDLRRGKPTNHVVYGEATAILAGDALQTLGGLLLSSYPKGKQWSERRNRVCRVVFEAMSSRGMAGGQALDLEATGNSHRPSLEELEKIHRMKTGELLRASLTAGAIWANAPPRMEEALIRYGEALGLAFQITDDILDVTADSEELGKTAGKDQSQGKATYPALLGLEESKLRAERLLEEAVEALTTFGSRGDALKDLALFSVRRKR